MFFTSKLLEQEFPSLSEMISFYQSDEVLPIPPQCYLGMVSHEMSIITIFGHKYLF